MCLQSRTNPTSRGSELPSLASNKALPAVASKFNANSHQSLCLRLTILSCTALAHTCDYNLKMQLKTNDHTSLKLCRLKSNKKILTEPGQTTPSQAAPTAQNNYSRLQSSKKSSSSSWNEICACAKLTKSKADWTNITRYLCIRVASDVLTNLQYFHDCRHSPTCLGRLIRRLRSSRILDLETATGMIPYNPFWQLKRPDLFQPILLILSNLFQKSVSSGFLFLLNSCLFQPWLCIL